jgi:hypothetical protein
LLHRRSLIKVRNGNLSWLWRRRILVVSFHVWKALFHWCWNRGTSRSRDCGSSLHGAGWAIRKLVCNLISQGLLEGSACVSLRCFRDGIIVSPGNT